MWQPAGGWTAGGRAGGPARAGGLAASRAFAAAASSTTGSLGCLCIGLSTAGAGRLGLRWQGISCIPSASTRLMPSFGLYTARLAAAAAARRGGGGAPPVSSGTYI